jgi:beta-1,4-mannosyltransferase
MALKQLPTIKVLMMGDGRAVNPYQQLLADGLSEFATSVTFPSGYSRVLPISRAAIMQKRADIVHLHWPNMFLRSEWTFGRFIYALKLLLDLLIVAWSGVPIVWTLHNLISHDTKMPKFELWLSRQIARVSKSVIVHSHSAAIDAISQLGLSSQKVTITPHGDYSSVYGSRIPKSEARALLRLPGEVPIILFFGLIRPYKNVPKLLRIMPLIRERVPNALLLVAGEAPDQSYKDELRAMAKGQEGVFLNLSRVPDGEVAPLFSSADVIALPFENSLTSGTVALANSMEVRLVAPRLTATMASETAIFANSGKDEDWVDAIVEALNSPNKLAQVAGSVDDGWKDISRIHREVYDSALKITAKMSR